MRQIVLDTETTGLDVQSGHRIIEVAGVELIDRQLTGRHFHRYINPERDIDPGALEVHGLTLEFLQDKPVFAEIVDELVAYLEGAELIIHNAPFDVGFLDAEFARLTRPPLAAITGGVTDTLQLAKSLHPGQRNSLDALCKRYGVDASARKLHGALIDCELLAGVYLAMTRGQNTLDMALAHHDADAVRPRQARPPVRRLLANAADEARHAAYMAALAKECRGTPIWTRDETAAAPGVAS